MLHQRNEFMRRLGDGDREKLRSIAIREDDLHEEISSPRDGALPNILQFPNLKEVVLLSSADNDDTLPDHSQENSKCLTIVLGKDMHWVGHIII